MTKRGGTTPSLEQEENEAFMNIIFLAIIVIAFLTTEPRT